MTYVCKNAQSKPASRHFNSCNHSISDFVAFSLSVINCSNNCCKTKEMQLIHALGILNPYRINERFTFCFNLLLSQNLFVFLTIFFSHTFLSFCFLHNCLIVLPCFITLLYKHLFVYLSSIHSDEGLQSKTPVFLIFMVV